MALITFPFSITYKVKMFDVSSKVSFKFFELNFAKCIICKI